MTDALLVAGVLDANNYLGGQLKLDRARAEQAIRTQVGEPLKLDLDQAVATIISAFQTTIGRHVGEALKRSGRKPADATLLAFGGGGPIIACGVAAAAGVKRVLIPRLSSVFSAFGIGFSHLAHEYQVPVTANSDISALRSDLRRRVERDMYGEGVDPAKCRYDVSLWTAAGDYAVERPQSGDQASLGAGETDPRLTVRGIFELPTTHLLTNTVTSYNAVKGGATIEINLDGRGAIKLALLDDAALKAGDEVPGPALVRGSYLTCVVASNWCLRVSSNGDLFVESK